LAQGRFHLYGNRYGYFRTNLCCNFSADVGCDFGAHLRSNFSADLSALYEWHWNHYW
jgi:hypothetical protein